MSVNSARGFTIIEVMLFLAITGGLFAALMIGVNTGITQQRYLDSVRSYKALIQNQYSEVLNTRNDNAGKYKCSDSNDGSVEQADPQDVNGTSHCVILGRAIQITDNGKKVVTSSVTGCDSCVQNTNRNDLSVLIDYKPKLATFDTETTDIDWGANLTVAADGGQASSNSTAVILILRSPTTGNIRLFTSPQSLGNSTDVASMITQESSSTIVKNCVYGDSGLLPKQMISIDPRIASPDAVSADGGENEVCQR